MLMALQTLLMMLFLMEQEVEQLHLMRLQIILYSMMGIRQYLEQVLMVLKYIMLLEILTLMIRELVI